VSWLTSLLLSGDVLNSLSLFESFCSVQDGVFVRVLRFIVAIGCFSTHCFSGIAAGALNTSVPAIGLNFEGRSVESGPLRRVRFPIHSSFPAFFDFFFLVLLIRFLDLLGYISFRFRDRLSCLSRVSFDNRFLRAVSQSFSAFTLSFLLFTGDVFFLATYSLVSYVSPYWSCFLTPTSAVMVNLMIPLLYRVVPRFFLVTFRFMERFLPFPPPLHFFSGYLGLSCPYFDLGI